LCCSSILEERIVLQVAAAAAVVPLEPFRSWLNLTPMLVVTSLIAAAARNRPGPSSGRSQMEPPLAMTLTETWVARGATLAYMRRRAVKIPQVTTSAGSTRGSAKSKRTGAQIPQRRALRPAPQKLERTDGFMPLTSLMAGTTDAVRMSRMQFLEISGAKLSTETPASLKTQSSLTSPTETGSLESGAATKKGTLPTMSSSSTLSPQQRLQGAPLEVSAIGEMEIASGEEQSDE